ncbi:assimilatory sulfite reductase [Gymnopilus junonius]|uniref:assimilatory sulfite reductase (NADPH) n=1 Tax=Gymnopilus junonius TaxID=109634 RepID=A0A9P5P488_GYMJU|nr:assimilatory sulfite reductase [Gymnopilus junonius]
MASEISGSSTPLSSTTTLSSPSSPHIHKITEVPLEDPFNNPLSSVYVYDVAEQVGFGTLTKEWAKTASNGTSVVDLQTRPGAGLSLVGRLSQGTSLDALKGTTLTAYTTPSGLALMAPSLPYLPPATPNTRLVIQVPAVTPIGETLALSPTLSSLASVWSILPENVSVLLSSTPQQAVDFASLSYKVANSHVIHLFDHHSTSREIGHSIIPLRSTFGDGLTIEEALQKAGYQLYEYLGDENATNVVILLNGPLALILKAAFKNCSGLGAVVVNALSPWNEETLRSVIPSSATTVHVLDEVPNSVTQGNLYVQVFSSLWNDAPKRAVYSYRITPTQTQTFITAAGAFLHFIEDISHIEVQDVSTPDVKKVLLFSIPRSSLSPSAAFLEDLFSRKAGISSRLLTDHDVFSKPGGITANRLLISRSNTVDFVPISAPLPLDPNSPGHSDFLGILDQSLLKSHSILKHAKKGSIVLLVTSWTPVEVLSNIPQQVAAVIVERQLSLYIIDIKGPIQDTVQNLLFELVFLRFFLGASASEPTVLQLARTTFGDVIEGVPLVKLGSHAWSSLQKVSIPPLATPSESPSLKEFEANAIAVEIPEGQTVVNGARLSSWHDAAKHLLFPAVFTPQYEGDSSSNPSLRPEASETTFLITCTVNRRLTPLEYNRNVFHLEFDTSSTGLKYAIGEALGVHGWNDEAEVHNFCAWYGVDPERLITIPVPGDDTKMHTRTVLQALQQQIDLFGRPPKSFYTDLAEYATNDVDRYALHFIGSPEGSFTFKKLSEKDTVTFADVLKKYPSAKPGIELLCELIGDIKPRHYSIASAQSVVGDRVDLLVVTVDWVTPEGSPRYGQCTRYLAGLKIGQKVTVSIKPSVMKLPPNPKQPLIMAGLGTGAAPFRAFLQHLAWLTQKGEEIGPVYYYFGSRHQAAEYLYGEEIEAFLLQGVITRAGLAFSRDSPEKVYIQHKMLEDSEELAKMLHDNQGVFYLCGPTWPVPDVYEALVNALVKYKGADPIKAGEYLEGLKEEERYVLEVY